MANYLPSQQSAKWARARIKPPPSSVRIDAAYIDLVAAVDADSHAHAERQDD